MSAPPSISIVTPSFNQAPFLAAAIESVLSQGYPALEYFVMDGGSQDGSAEIIQRYADRLTGWVSAPDGGQYAAVTAGFARSRGEVLAWLNSDDAYCPWALSVVGEIFARFPQIEWLTTARPLFWDRAGRAVHCPAVSGYARQAFLDREHFPGGEGFQLGTIQQESTFWRRSLWERAGGFSAGYPLAGDFALWGKFFEQAELYAVETPLGGFRTYGEQITGHSFMAYLAECEQCLAQGGGRAISSARGKMRELAVRAPAALWPALARAGLMHRAKVVRYDLRAREWCVRERFV